MDPSILTYCPVTQESLINDESEFVKKIYVDKEQLAKHMELLEKLEEIATMSLKKNNTPDTSDLDAQIYYVFTNEDGEKILDVTMWGLEDNCVYVNDIPVPSHDDFYNIIYPFLSKQEERSVRNYISLF